MGPYGEHGLLFAVGFPCGVVWSNGAGEGIVRAGIEYLPLPPEQYALWLAHTRPLEPISGQSFAELTNGPDIPALVADLERQGLLVRLSGDPRRDRPVLEATRLHLLSIGLGATDQNQSAMCFATSQGASVQLDPISYFLLIRSATARSLWDLCSQSATDLESAPETAARAVLSMLPPVLSTGSALLDRVL